MAAKKVTKKLPHQLVLGQILVADSLKLLTPPPAGIGAELFDTRPLEFAYALCYVRMKFIDFPKEKPPAGSWIQHSGKE